MSKERLKSLLSFFTMNRRQKQVEKERFLPAEIIAEILSWLPVKSVLKFKSVCKLWLSITEDPNFIHTHMTRCNQYIWEAENSDSGYLLEAFYQGLAVECKSKLPFFHIRLRNPSTNIFLDLPNVEIHPINRYFVMPCYVSRTRTLKIILPFPGTSDHHNLSFKIITVGFDDAWRTLHVPFTCKLQPQYSISLTVLIDGVYFRVAGIHDDPCKLGLLCLEVESEKLWTISGPTQRGSFNYWEYFSPRLLNWAGKPSLARLENRKLDVWVLEDYRKQVWAKQKIIIDLGGGPMINYDHYLPYQFLENQLWLHHCDQREGLLKYDIVSKVLTHIDAPAVPQKKLRGLATLIELKGMKPYVVSKNKKRTSRCWASCCFRTKI